MTTRHRIKKASILIVLGLFLLVTMGSFVMYLFSDKVQAPVNNNEVQPSTTITTWTIATWSNLSWNNLSWSNS